MCRPAGGRPTGGPVIPAPPDPAPLWRALHGVAAFLVLAPLLQLLGSVWPLRFGAVGWRFGAVGLLANALVTPIAGLALAMVAAFLLGQWRLLRGLGHAALAAAGLLLVILFLFALDYLQLRAGVRPDARGPYDLATYRAMTNAALAIAVLGGLAGAARAVGRGQPRGTGRAGDGPGLVVGRGGG